MKLPYLTLLAQFTLLLGSVHAQYYAVFQATVQSADPVDFGWTPSETSVFSGDVFPNGLLNPNANVGQVSGPSTALSKALQINDQLAPASLDLPIYTIPLTLAQQNALTEDGWTMTLRVKVLASPASSHGAFVGWGLSAAADANTTGSAKRVGIYVRREAADNSFTVFDDRGIDNPNVRVNLGPGSADRYHVIEVKSTGHTFFDWSVNGVPKGGNTLNILTQPFALGALVRFGAHSSADSGAVVNVLAFSLLKHDPTPVFVDPLATGGTDTGESWANAYRTLQKALDFAPPGSEIRVAGGLNRSYVAGAEGFRIGAGLRIVGGYDGTETRSREFDQSNPSAVWNKSILTGRISASEHAIHVVDSSHARTSPTLLKGFVIRDGATEDWRIPDPPSGGGLVNDGGLVRLQDVRFSGNDAANGGAISSEEGFLTTESVWIIRNRAGSGGAIRQVGGVMILDRAHITENNSNLEGGAIYQEGGMLTITRSNISRNSAVSSGGALYLRDGTLDLSNSTVSENQAQFESGAIDSLNSTVRLSRSTFVGNFGAPTGVRGAFTLRGALDSPQAILDHCIVWGNLPRNFTTDFNRAQSAGWNYVGNQTAISGIFDQAGDVITTADPLLGPLTFYAANESAVPAMHPLLGSPVIDAGNTGGADELDQRRLPRRVNTATDLGAVESGPVSLVTSLADSGPGSLRGLIAAAPQATGTVFGFSPALAGQTIALTSGEIELYGIFIDGSNLPERVTLSGNDSSRIFTSSQTNNPAGARGACVVHSVNLTNGRPVGESFSLGGAVRSSGFFSLVNCDLTNNQASWGGALWTSALGIISGSRFSNNTADAGGALLSLSEGLDIEDSRFSGNSATGTAGFNGHGGGLMVPHGHVKIIRSTIDSNTASTDGGGLSVGQFFDNYPTTETEVHLRQSTVSRNSANGNGGGIALANVFGTIRLRTRNATIALNTASGVGGGISAEGVDLNLIRTTISENSASQDPGVFTGVGTASDPLSNVIAGNLLLDGSLADENSPTEYFGYTGSQPRLSPLGDFGGPTETMIPLAGSPLNRAGAHINFQTAATDNFFFGPQANFDQRGYTMIGGYDIGSTNTRPEDISDLWDTDWDGDGFPYGFEQAFGSDPRAADRHFPGYPRAVIPSGETRVHILIQSSPHADPRTRWSITRSEDLNDFSTFVYGPSAEPPPSLFLDPTPPNSDRAFYRVEIGRAL